MKKIKPIVLKDATKLTNSQMKEIRGGDKIDNIITSSVTCSAQCATGALKEYVYMDCSTYPYSSTCAILHNEHETMAVCIRLEDGYDTGLPKYEDRCGNPLPPLGV